MMFDKIDNLMETAIYQAITAKQPDLWNILSQITKLERKSICPKSGNTILHIFILQTNRILSTVEGDEEWETDKKRSLLAIIYKLVVVGEASINVRNRRGNSPLHMAVLLPKTMWLLPHMMRLGADSSIFNNNGVRVLFNYQKMTASLVRGFPNATGCFWSYVRHLDLDGLQRCLDDWYRVETSSSTDQKAIDVAHIAGDYVMLIRLMRARVTNEMVNAAMALDLPRVKAFVEDKFTCVDVLSTSKRNVFLSKPLTAELHEYYGEKANEIIEYLISQGAPNYTDYFKNLQLMAFEIDQNEFVKVISNPLHMEDICSAYEILKNALFNINARRNSDGATYLHFLVERYVELFRTPVMQKGILRLISKLALKGVDLHARDKVGRTALVLACDLFQKESSKDNFSSLYDNVHHQNLLRHLIRLGVDSSIGTPDGRYVVEDDKNMLHLVHINQRKLNNIQRAICLPGIWPCVDALLDIIQKKSPTTNTSLPEDLVKRFKVAVMEQRVRLRAMRNGVMVIDLVRTCLPPKGPLFPKGKSKDKEHVSVIVEQLNYLIEILFPEIWSNEFILAIMADDVDLVKHCLAYGNGEQKVNMKVAGFSVKNVQTSAIETVDRPILLHALELASTECVKLVLEHGADVSMIYAEGDFHDPLVFWTFQPHISLETMLTVVSTPNYSVALRRISSGGSLLQAVLELARFFNCHDEVSAVRNWLSHGAWISAIVNSLLAAGVNLAWKDEEGHSACSLIFAQHSLSVDDRCRLSAYLNGIREPPESPLKEEFINQLEEAKTGRPLTPLSLINRHLIQFVETGDVEALESLLLDGYEHLSDPLMGPVGWRKRKDLLQLAEVSYQHEVAAFLRDESNYRTRIQRLHQAIYDCEIEYIDKETIGNFAIYGRDWRSRNLLHIAVLCHHTELARLLLKRAPSLGSARDIFGYTPYHYALCLDRSRDLYEELTKILPPDPALTDQLGRTLKEYVSGVNDRRVIIQRELRSRCPPQVRWKANSKFANSLSLNDMDIQNEDLVQMVDMRTEEEREMNEKIDRFKLPKTVTWPNSIIFPIPGAFYGKTKCYIQK